MVAQGDSWQLDDEFNLTWENPVGQQTPIASAHYELCPAIPLGPCTTHQIDEEGIESATIAVPYLGWFWLRIWLEDAAGNVNSDATSGTVMLRYDNGAPPSGRLYTEANWINGSSPNPPTFTLGIEPAAEWPLSGMRGYSVTLDGTPPDETVDALAEQDYETWEASYLAEGLAEGVTELRMSGVSNAGVLSATHGTALIWVDRSPPTVVAEGLGSSDHWHTNAVVVNLTGVDQAGLSGMEPAAEGEPVEDGGYLEVSVDGGPVELVRGGHVELPFGADGEHSVSARAFDVAGNPSSVESIEFKIDRTSPTGSFDRQDPADPRRVSVTVADALSGIADGRIEFRRSGSGGFSRLTTTRQGGKLVARLDDLTLSPGRYEFRAVVTDVAGNQGLIEQRVDGKAMALDLPVRTPTTVEARVISATKRCATPKRSRKKRQRRKRICRTIDSRSTVAYGKRIASAGRLVSRSGAPIPNATIKIEGQPRSGGLYAQLGEVRTDALGTFRFEIPPGPSRTARYVYAGTNTSQPASVALTTKVLAAARLKVDRRRVRNGRSVRFTGRLLGAPIPEAGKVVALQAKVGRRWRTFATPRAGSKGTFRYRYRFTSTTGVRRYAFRALVTREAAYPYERGTSKTVRVTVRGR
jgi:hypothetical protein